MTDSPVPPQVVNSQADEERPLLGGRFKDSQSTILPHKRLLVVFPALALVQFTSFLDQTAISTSVPAIASGLNTGSSTPWVGTSFLITSTSIQLVNGRFSDIFGRKTCLIAALAIMGLGNLFSGCSRTPAELFATRAFTGFGAGAINALVQITISDITKLEERGYYFGIMGIAVAFGNGLGPVVGGFLTEKTSWRWAFWFISPLTAVAVVYLKLVLPGNSTEGNVWKKLKIVDWLGVLTSMVAIILILVRLHSLSGSYITNN
jgi:MFS family permease